jgi:hypothetical protein
MFIVLTRRTRTAEARWRPAVPDPFETKALAQEWAEQQPVQPEGSARPWWEYHIVEVPR